MINFIILIILKNIRNKTNPKNNTNIWMQIIILNFLLIIKKVLIFYSNLFSNNNLIFSSFVFSYIFLQKSFSKFSMVISL